MMTPRFGGHQVTVAFSDQLPANWTMASYCDTKSFAKYFWGMLNRGIYLPCSQYEACFISRAHSQQDIDNTIDAACDVFRELL